MAASQGAELEAAAQSDVPTANNMGSMRTAAQLLVSTLTVKDLGQGTLSPTGECFLPPLTSSRQPLQACSETCLPGESRLHQPDNTDHHKAQ